MNRHHMAARSLRMLWLGIPLLLCSGSCEQEMGGCTDPLASNFSGSASYNDGSCTYPGTSLDPEFSLPLDSRVAYTSGLAFWDSQLWTHNDSGDPDLYGLDTVNAQIVRVINLGEEPGTDREDMAQDEEYFYIGDFGNNSSGDRADLHVLRYSKDAVEDHQRIPDTIWFTYEDQEKLISSPPNQTDFDCEAMVVRQDSIYLFTKQWVSEGTAVYVLPAEPGCHTAIKQAVYQVGGLITGAEHISDRQVVILCGYNKVLQPFLLLLYDFPGNRFFDGNKRKLQLNLPFHQVEGIAAVDGFRVFVSNEFLEYGSLLMQPQKLHGFDLSEYLSNFLNP